VTTASQIAQAISVYPATRKFTIRDEGGCRYEGTRTEHVLAALSRSDRSGDLPSRIRTVAYAIYKSLTTARMNTGAALKLQLMTPYQVCQLIAAVDAGCPETTIGGICDGWLPGHIRELTAAA
jgi:hypothetical protein